MGLRLEIIDQRTQELVPTAKQLFLEYVGSLDFSLCFQDFDKELAELPGDYSKPSGRLIVAFEEEAPAGCVALRKIDEETCEMKRLYVRPEFRTKGIGRSLAVRVVKEAEEIGYKKMRLDTVPSMKEAISLYHSLGFTEIEQYRRNPIAGAIFMELTLWEKSD